MTRPQTYRRSSAICLIVTLFSTPLPSWAFAPHSSKLRAPKSRNLDLEGPFRRKIHPANVHHSFAPLYLQSKKDDKPLAPTANGRCLAKFFSSAAVVALLAVAVQFTAVSPAEASSTINLSTTMGQFSASVSPPKSAKLVAEQSGKTTAKTKGVATCQPISAVSSLNSNLSRKCKEQFTSDTDINAIDDEPMSAQALEHQQLLDNLAKEPDWFNYAAAFSASIISTLIIHPLDTIKVRLMTDSKKEEEEEEDEDDYEYGPVTPQVPSNIPVSSTALSAATGVYGNSMPSPVGGTQKILDDIRSLYSGILPNAVKEGPPSALYLGLYESSIVFLKQYPFFTDHKLVMYLLAGAIGEMVGSIIRAPAEAVKTRVQTGGSTVEEAIQTVFLSEEGRRNTFRAWSSSIFRDVPAGAVQIAIFEALKLFLITTPYINIDIDNLLSESILGGIGGGIGAFLTTPSDRVTTLIISSDDEISVVDGAKQIWEDQGFKGFFVGSTERSSYWFFAVGIFLSAYCALRHAAIPLFVQ